VWLVASDGKTAARRISDPALNATGPRWSPDSELLAFTARRRGANANNEARAAAESPDDVGDAPWFVRVNPPSTAPFHIRGVSGAPVFSPDNKWIAFTR